MSADSWRLVCPSAQLDWPNARVFGVVEGTPNEPTVRYLSEPIVVDDVDAFAALTAPVAPTDVLRIAAHCGASRCAHFVDDRCGLVDRVVAHFDTVVEVAPSCAVRSSCRWWAQAGVAACRRCPQVVTTRRDADAVWVAVATPARKLTG